MKSLLKLLAVCMLLISLASCGATSKTQPANEQTGETGNTVESSNTISEDEDIQYAKSGTIISFETTDVNGNTVKSEDLFGENKFTLINLWQSWCPPCIAEMPDLNAINDEYKQFGVGVVGILLDGNETEGLTDGLEIIEETGAKYTVILPPENIMELLPAQAVPTSYFVDRKGMVLGLPIVGANPDEYRNRIEEYLSEGH